ncbi:hypothetical protein PISL3812_05252 [Talaromyces islandicus]|uniref:Uncharacterized protein n=1 Tax=Talaromyces islandicus TaxID=28573 RepID=A0A0U1LY35_TALIS|nr:hypothetical protein PISL3812_05252 [Talaromyces islandicus]
MLGSRSVYVASDSECDAQSRRASRSNPPNIRVEKPENPYERRLRRKTREDRYDPKGNHENEKAPLPAKAIRKKNIVGKRNGNCRIGERFCADNIRSGRLTVNFNENLGIFRKGKTSAPVHRSDVPYLNFSETKFLSKEPQSLPNTAEPTDGIQEQKRLDEDEAVASRFKKSLRKPLEPKDATLSNIHNSECPSTCRPNSPRQEPSQALEGNDFSLEIPSTGDGGSVVLDAGPPLSGTGTLRGIEYSGISIDKKLFESLGNCDQLAIPYEEYKPTFPHGVLYSLEDLKHLCAMREHLQLRTDIDFIKNNTKATLGRSFGAEDSLGDHDILSLEPELMDVTEDSLFEFFLDTENQFTNDTTSECLEGSTDPGEAGMRNIGTHSGSNRYSTKSVFESDLEKFLPLTTSGLTRLNQSVGLHGDIFRLKTATTSDPEITKQVATIESSLVHGTVPRNIDGRLLSMSAKDQRHDEATGFSKHKCLPIWTWKRSRTAVLETPQTLLIILYFWLNWAFG